MGIPTTLTVRHSLFDPCRLVRDGDKKQVEEAHQRALAFICQQLGTEAAITFAAIHWEIANPVRYKPQALARGGAAPRAGAWGLWEIANPVRYKPQALARGGAAPRAGAWGLWEIANPRPLQAPS